MPNNIRYYYPQLSTISAWNFSSHTPTLLKQNNKIQDYTRGAGNITEVVFSDPWNFHGTLSHCNILNIFISRPLLYGYGWGRDVF